MVSLLIAFNLALGAAPAVRATAFAQREDITVAVPESITVRNADESSATTSTLIATAFSTSGPNA